MRKWNPVPVIHKGYNVNTYEEVEAEVHALISPLLDENKGLASLSGRTSSEEEAILHISQESVWLPVPESLALQRRNAECFS